METKSDLITYCLTYKDVYEDYPFRDSPHIHLYR